MKLFLVGEGKTDCGIAKDGGWQEGPVQTYIRKIRPKGIEIYNVHKAEIQKLRKTKRQSRSMKGLKGHSVKAFFIAQAAAENGCDAVAMYLDADKPSSPKERNACQQRYDHLKKEVLDGLHRGSELKAATIIPMKMIECWLLGDANAFQKCCRKIPSGERYFRNPELLWGDDNDPQSDYPKHKLDRALKECGAESCLETFVELAGQADIKILRRTCPISFDDFYAQIMAL